MGKTYYVAGIPFSDELYHHGIKGQKHGVRRFQNLDGTLTAAGRRRYGIGDFLSGVGNSVSGAAKSVGNYATNAYNSGKKKVQNTYNDLSGKTYVEAQKQANDARKTADHYNSFYPISNRYVRNQNDQVRNTLNRQSSAARNKAENANLDAMLAGGRGVTSSDYDNYRGAKARRKESESQLQDAQRRLADSVRNRNPEASWNERRSHANEEALLERNVERAANKARNEKMRSANVDALGSRRAEQFANKAKQVKRDSANVDALSERRREQLATKEKNQRKAYGNESAWYERNAERLQNKADQAYNRSFNVRVENAREAISNIPSNVSQAAQDYAERIGDIVEDAYGDVAEYLGKNAKKAKKAAQQAAKSIKDAGSKGVSAVTGAANKAYSQVASFLGGLFGKKK